MNGAIESMLALYNGKGQNQRQNAIKEIIQEIALAGLSHGGFFQEAAFYGGTCLRIFHGLDRFSEDLDFALLKKNKDFNLEAYFPALRKEFESYGIDVSIDYKKKSQDSPVQSAFLKGDTLTLMLSFFPERTFGDHIASGQRIKVKFEVDTDNADGGTTETKYQMLPAPYEVRVFDKPTLFAGKIHALICRDYKQRVKGRDYYDYLFYVGRGIKINLEYLENKLKNTHGKIADNETLTLPKVKELLKERFANVDYELAKTDVIPFVDDAKSLDVWKKEFFLSTLDKLEAR